MNDLDFGRRGWATTVVAAVVCWLGSAPLSADPFINLTFDEPDLSGPLELAFPGGPWIGNTSQLLRGWNATEGGIPVPRMSYAPYNLSTDGGRFNLRGNPPDRVNTSFGANSLLISADRGVNSELRLEQTGTIPLGAVELWISSKSRIEAFINGEKVGDFDPRLGGPQVLDVSPFAGETVLLGFLVRPNSSTSFDILGFTSVPEPSTWALLGLGAVALGIAGGRKLGDEGQGRSRLKGEG